MDNGPHHEPFQSLEVDILPDRDRVIVAPRGEIDLATVERVRQRLNELEDVGFHTIVLDLRKVTFIDSSGVKLVVDELNKDGIDFAVIPGPAQVQRIFELTGLIERVPLLTPTGSRLTGLGPTADG